MQTINNGMGVFIVAFHKKSFRTSTGIFLAFALITALLWYWSRSMLAAHIDALIGVAAAVIVVPIVQLADIWEQYSRLHRLEGKYNCHGYVAENSTEACRALKIDNKGLDSMLDNDPDSTYPSGSTAKVEYLGDTSLKITLSENNHENQWTGRCIMESEEVGILAWAYDRLGKRDKPWNRNGIKRLAVIDTENEPLKLCLFTYNNDQRFGRELLVKYDR